MGEFLRARVTIAVDIIWSRQEFKTLKEWEHFKALMKTDKECALDVIRRLEKEQAILSEAVDEGSYYIKDCQVEVIE